jgi:hypothetical protein
MKQRIQDLVLLLRQEKKYQVIAALALLAVLYVTLSDGSQPRRIKKQDTSNKAIVSGDKEAFKDVVTALSSEVDAVKASTQETQKAVVDIRTNMEEDRAKVAEIFNKMLATMNQQAPAGVTQASMATSPDAMAVMPNSGAALESTDALASFGETMEPAIAPPAPPAPKRTAVIMPGDSVKAKLLAGVNAPTDGTPYPVVLKLIGNIEGPDHSNLPLGEARVVAAAQGSLTDSRVLLRLTTMNIRLPNGQKKEVPIDGWVVGEDGIRGMEGILIDPFGKAIAGAAGAGFLSALGQGFAARETGTERSIWGSETVVNGDPAKYALGKGVAGGSNAIAELIKERGAMMVPHVAVYSGREATLVFSKTVTIDDLIETLEDSDSDLTSSLD